MAIRVTEAEVRSIVDADEAFSMLPFITLANKLTDKVKAADSASILDDALLKEIERWLAAHFYAIRDPQYTSKSTGGASASFQGQTAMGLDSTLWGQTAKIADITGYLQNLDQKRRPTLKGYWLGYRPSEQTDYVDRD